MKNTYSHSANEDFAWIYNKHWGLYADQALAIVDQLILPFLHSGAHILDLCCGTGQLANKLASKGYRVTGIDVSDEMIRFARDNAPNGDFIIQDARHFHFLQTFDAAISTYDGLNFIMSLPELTDVFENVYESLQSGGLFLFDLNTETGYLYHWEDGTFSLVEDDHACIVRYEYNADEKLVRFDVTIFRLLDEWTRTDLAFYQRCYSSVDIRYALNLAGFTEINTYGYHDELGLTKLTPESERAYFLCRKP